MKNRPQLIVLLVCLALGVAIPCYVWLRKPPAAEMLPPRKISIAVGSNLTVVPPPPFNAGVEEPPAAPLPPKEIVGIGAVLKKDNARGAIMITGVAPNSPAAAAGLAGNFIIRKIDNIVADGIGLQECVNLLRGAAGTTVRLELFDVDANETRTVELTRQKIKL